MPNLLVQKDAIQLNVSYYYFYEKNGTDNNQPRFFISLNASVVDAAAHNIKQFRGDGLLTTLIVLQVKLT